MKTLIFSLSLLISIAAPADQSTMGIDSCPVINGLYVKYGQGENVRLQTGTKLNGGAYSYAFKIGDDSLTDADFIPADGAAHKISGHQDYQDAPIVTGEAKIVCDPSTVTKIIQWDGDANPAIIKYTLLNADTSKLLVEVPDHHQAIDLGTYELYK